jgi:cytochrome c553
MKHLVALFLTLAGLVSFSSAQAVTGDIKAGERKAAMCIGCHGIPGYQASFPQVHRVPRISGQHAKYITAALQAYAKGDRKHPTMRGIAASLTEQDMADLAAFYEQHGAGTGEAVPKALARPMPDALKDRLQTCVACHGANFNDTTDPANPRIAGQYADYLYVALRSYKVTGNANVGRNNATMGAMVQAFNDKELKQIADYLGSLPTDLKVIPQSRFR